MTDDGDIVTGCQIFAHCRIDQVNLSILVGGLPATTLGAARRERTVERQGRVTYTDPPVREETKMRRVLAAVAVLSSVGWAQGPAWAAPSASGTDLCVGAVAPCFSTIKEALDAAQNGDTIRVGPGTFAGGITIDKSVNLVGVSAAATRIEGGGPVLTIGVPDAPDAPTVSISGVTITGGFNTSSPLPFVAHGGGVRIPNGANFSVGATVSISSSVITGNRADPGETVTFCGFDCAFAFGGGIFNAGTLTVTDTTISDNVSGATESEPSVAFYAAGGGIVNGAPGSLTLVHSVVTSNRAAVNAPNGFNTDAGGIANFGTMTIESSDISRNTSSVAGAKPSIFLVDFLEANAGGIYLPDGSSTTITSSQINWNTVVASNTAGDASAEAGGIDSDGSLLIIDSSVDHNTTTAAVPPGSGFVAEAESGGLQIQGSTILRNSRIARNSVSATSMTGTALAVGGGLLNLASLTLEQSVVTANATDATGGSGASLGAGIANIHLDGPQVQLAITDSVVSANRLAVSSDFPMLGGGLFTLEITNPDPFTTGDAIPVTLTRTVIQGNQPDQCAGC